MPPAGSHFSLLVISAWSGHLPDNKPVAATAEVPPTPSPTGNHRLLFMCLFSDVLLTRIELFSSSNCQCSSHLCLRLTTSYCASAALFIASINMQKQVQRQQYKHGLTRCCCFVCLHACVCACVRLHACSGGINEGPSSPTAPKHTHTRWHIWMMCCAHFKSSPAFL